MHNWVRSRYSLRLIWNRPDQVKCEIHLINCRLTKNMEPIPIEYSRGESKFTSTKVDTESTLLDFWSWAFSDVLTNTTRGILAEFIVATALGINTKQPRDGWAKFDLEYMNHGVEIKSASYHQRWFQNKMSTISFNIPTSRAWDASTNKLEEQSQRQADLYILCLLSEKERDQVNPLDLDQWEFWILETQFLNERKRSQKSITYNSLLKEVGEPVCFHQIKHSVDELINKLA